MYDAGYTKGFYDAYGGREWERLEGSVAGRLKAVVHADFIARYVGHGDRVLDAGCGPGRFTVTAAKLGATVTALDLSEGQLELARATVDEAGVSGAVEGFVTGDIADLSMFGDGQFDAVICYGGALSYVCEQRQVAAAELVRVVRPGGVLLVSVMSRLGTMATLVRRPQMYILEDPEEWHVWRVAEHGDLPGFPTPEMELEHPSMHMYRSDELRVLFPDCGVLELAGSNVTTSGESAAANEILESPEAWATAVELERALCREPGLVDGGTHLILVGRKGGG
ncbi:MAG: class I SAM-dependent methyltransferase [bacterium]|nr:class I SAM-dependent methyltransferase [bacterium]MDE0235023.1 class I SAM-dependent methyltransferase [bacterium]